MTFVLPVGPEDELALRVGRKLRSHHTVLLGNLNRLARWEPWAEKPFDVVHAATEGRMDEHLFSEGRELPLVILHRGRVVGSVTGYLDGVMAEVSYWIDGEYEGRGIVTRAVRRLAAELVGRGAGCIYARIVAGNLRSRAVVERLGFAQVGVVTDGARFERRTEDVLVFALVAERAPFDAVDDLGLRLRVDSETTLVLAEPRHHSICARARASSAGGAAEAECDSYRPGRPACLVYVGKDPVGLLSARVDRHDSALLEVHPVWGYTVGSGVLDLAARVFVDYLIADHGVRAVVTGRVPPMVSVGCPTRLS